MKTTTLLLVLLAGLAAPPLRAQPPAGKAPPPAQKETAQSATERAPYVPPDYIRKAPTLPPHMVGQKPRQLSLAEAIETALRRNLALALARVQVADADAGRALAGALFEPLLLASAERGRSKSPPLTLQEGMAGQVLTSTQDSWTAGVQQRVPTGTELRLSFANIRSESTRGTAVEPVIYRSSLALDLTQPLLAGFSFTGRIQRAPVLRAEFASEAAREEARGRALLTVKATEDAYWGLVESWKTYEVNLGARQLAGEQLELTRRQIAAGVLPQSDLIGVEGTLAQREVAVVRAEAQIERAADQLRLLLNLPLAEWSAPLLPLDAPSFAHVEVAFGDALARARTMRPELGRTQIDLRRIALELEVARNSRLPRLDLRAGLGSVGQDDLYRQALDQAGRGRGPQWNVGLSLAWAPLQVAARAELARLDSALRGNQLTREEVLARVQVEIREAIRNIGTAERQLHASAKFRDLAERSLEVEQRRFLNGLSSNFFVAQRQAELAQARLAELEALIQHERASSDLQLATGELLDARQLKFELRQGG
jgi:outer membrane protein